MGLKTYYNPKEVVKPEGIARTLKAQKGTGNRPIIYEGIGVHDPYTGEARRIYTKKTKSPPLKSHGVLLASGRTNGTNTPPKSTKNTMENVTQETLLKSPQPTFQTMICSVADSLAKHFQSQAKEGDSMTPEELSFLKSLGFSETSDPDIFCLKMSKVYLVMTKEKLSRQYLGFSPTWGMSINGRFLTAKISESPKTGKECSLSDILEENPDRKYFLSEEAIRGILKRGKLPEPLEASGMDGKGNTIRQMPYEQTSRIHKKEGISPTIPTPLGGRHIPMICESDA